MPEHGTRSRYIRYKCRCASCSTVAAEYNRAYKEMHPGYWAERQKRLYPTVATTEREKSRLYRLNNPEKVRQYNKFYKETHREVFAEHQRRRNAKVVETDITIGWLLSLKATTERCEDCGVKLTDSIRQLDHIKPLCIGGAHMRDNVRYICKQCNLIRPKKTLVLKYS